MRLGWWLAGPLVVAAWAGAAAGREGLEAPAACGAALLVALLPAPRRRLLGWLAALALVPAATAVAASIDPQPVAMLALTAAALAAAATIPLARPVLPATLAVGITAAASAPELAAAVGGAAAAAALLFFERLPVPTAAGRSMFGRASRLWEGWAPAAGDQASQHGMGALAIAALGVGASGVPGCEAAGALLVSGAVVALALDQPAALVLGLPGAVAVAQVALTTDAAASVLVVALATAALAGALASRVRPPLPVDPPRVAAAALGAWLLVAPGSWRWAGPAGLGPYQRSAAVAAATAGLALAIGALLAARPPGWGRRQASQ